MRFQNLSRNIRDQTLVYFPTIFHICIIFVSTFTDYFLSNIVVFLAFGLEFSSPVASSVVNLHDATSGIFAIVGAALNDSYLNHHGVIFTSSIVYFLGLLLVAMGMSKTGYFDGEWETLGGWWMAKPMIVVGISISGVGKLALKNSSSTFRDQESNNSNLFTNFLKFVFGDDSVLGRYAESGGHIILLVFSKYTTKIAFIVISSLLATKYKNSEMAFTYYSSVELWIPPAGLVLVSIMSLFYYKSFIKKVEDRQNPLGDVLHVYYVAYKKKNIYCPHDPQDRLLYRGNQVCLFPRTKGLRCLDKAAVPQSLEPEEERRMKSLCTVAEVEAAKCLLRMLPLCLTFLVYGMVKSMAQTLFLLQAENLKDTLYIDVPLQTLIFLGELSGVATKGVYYFLLSEQLPGLGKKYGPLLKYAMGFVLATFCCTVASWVATAKESVFLLVPQFLLMGAMDEVSREGIKGFFCDQLPPSIVKYGTPFTDAVVGLGALFSILLVEVSGYSLESNDSLGEYYRIPAVVSFVLLYVYILAATRYRFMDKEETRPNLLKVILK